MHDRLTERLDCYDDRALSMTEHQHLREQLAAAAAAAAFKPWWGRVIDAEDAPLSIKAGARYQVIGEETKHIDGRPLNKADERWILAETADIPGQEVLKSRIVPEDEFIGWRIRNVKAGLASLKAELDAIGEPDGRF